MDEAEMRNRLAEERAYRNKMDRRTSLAAAEARLLEEYGDCGEVARTIYSVGRLPWHHQERWRHADPVYCRTFDLARDVLYEELWEQRERHARAKVYGQQTIDGYNAAIIALLRHPGDEFFARAAGYHWWIAQVGVSPEAWEDLDAQNLIIGT